MSNLIINVTAEDIRRGTKSWQGSSPVALAASRAASAVRRAAVQADVTVYTYLLTFKRKGKAYLGVNREPPETACRFIADFDAGRRVKPIRFELSAFTKEELTRI